MRAAPSPIGMRKLSLPNATADGFTAWHRLGLDWIEMMSASQAIITRRVAQRPTPQRIHTMASEKAVAAVESSAAMTRQLLRPPPATLQGAWLAWMSLLSAGMAPYVARTKANSRRR